MKIGAFFFSIKEEKVFIKNMEIIGKVRNFIKNKFNNHLINPCTQSVISCF